MRPHLLRMTGFGAFAESVEIDFDRLAGAGLFLLHGPTGAGKSTLLDGIGFALFGRVPGARHAAKRLRSDHAAPDCPTVVVLEVSFGSRRLRITRSPDYERPKRRGEGTTTEKAKVLLEELCEGGWEFRSDRFDEAGHELAELVGMNADQFFQVVLLPQGEFAQFLRANSVERGVLLQRLFSTERFAEAEAWLAGRRREAADRVAVAEDAVTLQLARIVEAAGQDVAEHDPLPWAQAALESCRAAVAVAEGEVRAATEVRDGARASLESLTALADRQARRRSALTRQEGVDARRDELHHLQAELDAAVRALEVAGVLRAGTERRLTRDAALAAEAQARAGLAAAGLAVDLPPSALADAVAVARAREGSLTALRTVSDSWDREQAAVAHALAEEADARAALVVAQARLAELPTRRAQLEVGVRAGRDAAARIPALQAERDVLQALRPDLVALLRLEETLRRRAEEHLSARQTQVALWEKANALRTASINTMVARLAFALEQDTPCPVCGATEHPDPSALRDEGVSSEDEEAARREAEVAQQAVADLESQLAADRAASQALRARVGEHTLDSVETEIADVDLELDLLQAQVAVGHQAEQTLAELEVSLREETAGVVALDTEAAAAARRGQEAQARADAAKAQLVGALDGAVDLEQALAVEAGRIVAAETALEAARALSRAQDEMDRTLADAVQACTEAGFASTEHATLAARPDSWRVETADILQAAAAEDAAVRSLLADPELDVPLQPAAPVSEGAAALADADAELTVAGAAHGAAAVRCAALERLVPTLRTALEELEPVRERAAIIRRLADLAAGQGQNSLRMTLSSFVLAARLEEVAAAASTRLRRMTQGRYELIHTDGAARAGSRSGLGLLARDAWTGQDRETSTLSGGEMFLASLALALGLADVVTAESGGARIDALFVDEGFGSLDEDTLDEVMDVLDGLREGGRLIGLVSHVGELRQRIPAQVEVRKTRAGSTAVLHGC